LSKNLDNDLRVIARQAGLTKCEQLEKAVGEWAEVKKLKSECAQLQANGITEEKCKYFNRK